MRASKYCNCCGKISLFYFNGNTGEFSKYCLSCKKNYTLEERRKMEFKNILNVISSKEINEKCTRLH